MFRNNIIYRPYKPLLDSMQSTVLAVCPYRQVSNTFWNWVSTSLELLMANWSPDFHIPRVIKLSIRFFSDQRVEVVVRRIFKERWVKVTSNWLADHEASNNSGKEVRSIRKHETCEGWSWRSSQYGEHLQAALHGAGTHFSARLPLIFAPQGMPYTSTDFSASVVHLGDEILCVKLNTPDLTIKNM